MLHVQISSLFSNKKYGKLIEEKTQIDYSELGSMYSTMGCFISFLSTYVKVADTVYAPHEPKRNGFDYWDENPEFYKDLVFRLVLQNDVVQNKDNRCVLYKIWSIETNPAKNSKKVSIRESFFFFKEKIWFVWFIGGYKNSWKWSAYFIKKRHQNNRESTK